MELCNYIYTYVSISIEVIPWLNTQTRKKKPPHVITKKAYDRIDVVVPKGHRQIIKDYAASQGKSLNRFICDAIDFQMNKERKTE